MMSLSVMADARTIYVDDDNRADPFQDGSEDHPYGTITRALNNADNGDTIIVKDGTYDEYVIINKAVSLIGNGSGERVIEISSGGAAVRITADNVAMKGFRVTILSGAGANCIVIEANNVTLEENVIENGERGIDIADDHADIVLKECVISDSSSFGIVAQNLLRSRIIGCTIRDTPGYNGIHIAYGEDNLIADTTITNSQQDGIQLYCTRRIDVRNTSIHGCGSNGIHCISDDDLIENCTITHCFMGISISHSGNRIANCDFHDNTHGLYISSQRNNISGCIVHNNSDTGVYLDGASHNLIYDNYIDNNTYNYKNLGGSSNNTWNISKIRGKNIAGGPYLGGNYWSDYTGNDTDGDGLGDTKTPYGPGDELPLLEWPNHPPTIEILKPDDDGEKADTDYTIEWNAADKDKDTLMIALYYDNDTNPDNGKTLIISGISNSGSYHWDTSEVEEGDYNILGTADDNNGSLAADYSGGTVHISHSPGQINHAPTIEITDPDGNNDNADDHYTIEWNASDRDGDTLEIDIYYDSDTNPDNGKTLIISGISNSGNFDWDTSDVEEGEYYICGLADDNNGSRVLDYSRGTICISHDIENRDPEIEITSVEKTDDYTLKVQWTVSDQDGDTLEIDLYFDTDTNPENGKNLIVEDLDDSGSYDWDISGMENGDYYILALARDPEGGEGNDYSEKITITLPELLPDFTILSIEIQPPVPETGNSVVIRVIIGNEGTALGTGNVEFLIDGVQLENKSLTLQPGREKTLSAVWTAVEGNHTVSVKVSVSGDSDPSNNEVVRVVCVAGAPAGKEKDSDDDFPVVYVGSALAAVVVAMVGGFAVYRKREEVASGVVRCHGCGGETQYSEEENDHYCWECGEYVGEMEKGQP